TLFESVSFRVATGECTGLVGPNGVGKSTVLRVVARDLAPTRGSVRVDGRIGVLPQDLGRVDRETTVRSLMARLSPLRVAAEGLHEAEARHVREDSQASGVALAAAVTRWSEVGGYREEQRWASCVERVLRQPFDVAEQRLIAELS